MDKLKFDFYGWMWILLISLIVILLLKDEFSDSSEKEEIKTNLVKAVNLPKESGIYVFEIDGHEYIYIVDGYRSGVCHKADCKHCKVEK